MGRSRYRIGDPRAPHFLTCTVLNWMPLFTRTLFDTIVTRIYDYAYRGQPHGLIFVSLWDTVGS